MADRRCFNKSVVRSNEFLDMPVSARCLYYELGMETDNRGYINASNRLLLYLGATPDDLKILIAKRFLLVRDNGRLLLQKHFRKNNPIFMGRYKETEFLSDFEKVYINENGDYTERDTGVKALEIHPKTNTQCELSESSVVKQNKLNQIKANQNKLNESKVIQSKETSKERYEDDFIFDED